MREQTIVVMIEDLVLLPELEHYNFSRTDEELRNLEDQIRTEGKIRDPIVVWVRGEELLLVDGFSRVRIIRKLGLEVPLIAHQVEFEGMEECKYWMRINQDSRRNLTDDQKSYFIGLLYQELKSDKTAIKRYLRVKGRADLLGEQDEDLEIRTAQLLGKIYRMNEKTIRRNAQFARGLELIRGRNPELAEQILHQTVKDEGKPIKVTRALVEKFGVARIPKQILAISDIQEAVDMIPKKDDERDDTEGDSLWWLFEKFLETPTLSLIQEIDSRLRQYLNSRLTSDKAA